MVDKNTARFDDKLARKARIACEKWREYFKHNIDKYHEMHEFIMGEQWSQDEQDDMLTTYNKVALTSNKLSTMANSLLGEQQQNTPQLQVVPMANCDTDVAQVRELITKDIMFSAGALTARQVAAEQAAIGGFGVYFLSTEYAHDKSFDQDIQYNYFKDSTQAFFDVGAETIPKTDGMHCGYYSRLSRKKFRDVYGKKVENKILSSSSITQSKEEIALAVQPDVGSDPFNWADSEAITILDFYVRKFKKDKLYKLSNGAILNQEEMDELVESSRKINQQNTLQQMQGMQMQDDMQQIQGMQDQLGMQQMPGGMQGAMPDLEQEMPKENGMDVNEDYEESEADFMTLWDDGEVVRIIDNRPSKRHTIMHYKIAGDYILDETEFPSETLPMIFVDQHSYYDKNGKQICRSFFADAKDTQIYINYLRTQSAYILKISRYDQWIGSKKNVASLDTQAHWRNPQNIQGLLTYDESASGAKPEQIRPPELSMSLFQQYQLAIEDLYTSTGLYPARMGNNGDEASGKAIDARTRQGSYSTYVFFNAINRATAADGVVINEMIPRVYDTERVLALMTPDEGMKNISINKETDNYGEGIENDIRKGTYQVRLKPGASYEGQKQEALESLREVLQVDPTAFNLIADLYADNLPLVNTIEIRNRLKTLVSPQVIEAGKTGKMPPPNQQPSPEQQAMQAEVQFKQAQIQIKQKELQLKQEQMQSEIDIEKMKLEIAQMEVMGEIEESKLRYLGETQRTESDQSIAHANNLVKILTHNIS